MERTDTTYQIELDAREEEISEYMYSEEEREYQDQLEAEMYALSMHYQRRRILNDF